MMRREEKRRKFHDKLLNTLYPPNPQPQDNDEEKEIQVLTSSEDFDVNLIPDDYGLQQKSSSSSRSDDNGDSECEQQKLTRAQRKRLRKKKLKEDVSRRGNIIGPLLPSLSNDVDDGNSAVQQDTLSVRQNADESYGHENSQRKKLKQRRMAKRLGKARLKSCDEENCVQDRSLELANEHNYNQERSFKSIDVENCVKDHSHPPPVC